MVSKIGNYIITVGSLVGLAIAFVAGLIFNKTGLKIDPDLIAYFELTGNVWVILLISLVIPLATSYLVYVIISIADTGKLGKLTANALFVHVSILFTALVFSISFGFTIVELIGDNLPRLSIPNSISEISPNNENVYSSYANYLVEQSRVIQKILGRTVLFLLFFSIVFAYITSKFFKDFSKKLLALSKSYSEKSIKWLQLFLLTIPVAVIVLVFPLAVQSGILILGVAGIFVIILSGMLLLFLFFLYFIVNKWGIVDLSTFTKGMLPSQIIAVSTRSSLATIPSMITAAETKFNLPKEITAIIIPFFISIFRLNRVISSPFKYIFLTYVYQLNFDVYFFLLFVLIQVVVSFGSPGIPSGGKYINLPIYLAAGIPFDGYILLKAVDAIPDIFKTLLNVTEAMTVTVLVAKEDVLKFHNTPDV